MKSYLNVVWILGWVLVAYTFVTVLIAVFRSKSEGGSLSESFLSVFHDMMSLEGVAAYSFYTLILGVAFITKRRIVGNLMSDAEKDK